AEIKYRDGRSVRKTFTFDVENAPAAVGFRITVDALCLRLRYPPTLWSSLGDAANPLHRAMRTARFLDQARQGPYLASIDNIFAREWLAQLVLSALSNEAVAKTISLDVAAEHLAQGKA